MFALGQTIRPCATETYTHEFNRTELWSFSKAKPTYLPKQLPPLFFDDVPPKSETFEIAACYYNAICEWTADIWHELTGHVYYLIHSASTVMEMSSLTLAVTAEGLAENCFPATGHPAEGFSDAVADLESKVGQLTKNPDLQKRLQGTLGAMRRPRNSDRLRELVTNLDIDQKVFKSWQRLRNAAAHGSVDQGDDHAELHSQNMELLYLCYRIVLAHIGYHGPATDYSKTGFPNVII